jgi:hypothetical protein
MEMLPVEPVQSRDETVNVWVQICAEGGEPKSVHLPDPKIWYLE